MPPYREGTEDSQSVPEQAPPEAGRADTQIRGLKWWRERESLTAWSSYFPECITCGITYSVPKPLWDYQQMKSGFHHCPNGHSQGWNQQETIEARLRRERDIARQQIARAEDEAREARAQAAQEAELRIKSEKAAQRLKKRMAAGTCPCCQRTFQNMSVHMRKQHPTFVADNIVVLNKAAS